MTSAIIRVIDLETTGLAPPEHAPVEIAYCDVVPSVMYGDERWHVMPGWSFVVNPGRPIPPEASAVHHLTDDDVRPALCHPWHEVLASVAAPLNPVLAFAAHKAEFERQWLSDDRTGGAPWICTWKCALRLWPDAPGHSNQVLRYWRRPAGIERARANPAHRAGPDAYVTAHLLRDMLSLAPIETLIQWSAEPALLVRVGFGKHRGQRWVDVDSGYLDWVLDQDFDDAVKFTVRHELARRAAARADEAAAEPAATAD